MRAGTGRVAKCSPRVWGWTGADAVGQATLDVFPTGVGMDRRQRADCLKSRGVPHGCGDGPSQFCLEVVDLQCSPRVWGWTGGGAEVRRDRRRVPHGCGDGPAYADEPVVKTKCSPRVWGWTGVAGCRRSPRCVFPTGVGMDRMFSIRTCPTCSCSPRVWGWTVR